jgi:hypothetical protein
MSGLTQAGRIVPAESGREAGGPCRPDGHLTGRAEYEAPGFVSISREYPAITHLCSYASSHAAGSTVRVGRSPPFQSDRMKSNGPREWSTARKGP